MLEQNNIKFTIYDEATMKPLKSLSRTEYKKKVLEIVKYILEKKEEFKQRGCLVVKNELIDEWIDFVEESLGNLSKNPEDLWYNAVVLEASLNAMERLNRGLELEISYRAIDIQEYGKERVYCNMRLSGWQNFLATQIVCNYHEQGNEFLEYRNKFVKSPIKQKKRISKN